MRCQAFGAGRALAANSVDCPAAQRILCGHDTGSRITTMYKDLGISMNMARETGAAMFVTSAAFELFQSGISMFPDEDNWSVVKLLEQIAGTEVTW